MDRCINGVNHYACLLILPLIFITVFDVVSRKIPGLQNLIIDSPLGSLLSPTKLQEMEWHLHACVFLLAFGATYLANGHVRVDLLKERFAIKTQAAIELFGILLLAIPYLAVMLFFAYEFVASSYSQNEMSAALTGLPYRWIIKSVLLLGMALLCLAIISTALRLIIVLFASAPLARQAQICSPQLGNPEEQTDTDNTANATIHHHHA
ncbi:hypothetical protein TDB9533_03390 [Thalassocella blandensis]|nr:hypothetical protein TDB9533_03390 [Thalassocella blandensis]